MSVHDVAHCTHLICHKTKSIMQSLAYIFSDKETCHRFGEVLPKRGLGRDDNFETTGDILSFQGSVPGRGVRGFVASFFLTLQQRSCRLSE